MDAHSFIQAAEKVAKEKELNPNLSQTLDYTLLKEESVEEVKRRFLNAYKDQGFYKYTKPHTTYVYFCRCESCLEKELDDGILCHFTMKRNEEVEKVIREWTWCDCEKSKDFIRINPDTGEKMKRSIQIVIEFHWMLATANQEHTDIKTLQAK